MAQGNGRKRAANELDQVQDTWKAFKKICERKKKDNTLCTRSKRRVTFGWLRSTNSSSSNSEGELLV
eukprot:1137465-Pelagomonas_calceolata.AAC.4